LPALDGGSLSRARAELIANQLVAYQPPLYQVLALGPDFGELSRAAPASPSPQTRSSKQTQSSPRRLAPPRPQPGGPADLQSTGPAPGQAQEPHPLARIFRSMALDSAPLDAARGRPFDSAQDVQDRPLDSTSQRKTP
jgi:hypothetical protein